MEDQHTKILFRLERDEDGYPPTEWESLWAKVRDSGDFEIDNIPFYVRGISAGDVVSAQKTQHGEWIFDELLTASGNSTFRVYASEPEQVASLREEICNLGADCEGSNIKRLFSVHLPASQPLGPLHNYLSEKEKEGVLEFEEAAIRHD